VIEKPGFRVERRVFGNYYEMVNGVQAESDRIELLVLWEVERESHDWLTRKLNESY
jgi:hypothetical protein